MSKIENISNIIDIYFREETITKLKEDQANMSIDFVSDGQRCLAYIFDKNLPNRDFPKGLFPFFNRGVPNVTSLCDYILFTEKGSELYVLLIELKKGNDNVTRQLYASKCFVDYIISTVNRVYKSEINPQIRLISIRERHVKPKQKQKEIVYENNFHNFCSSKFRLKAYLK